MDSYLSRGPEGALALAHLDNVTETYSYMNKQARKPPMLPQWTSLIQPFKFELWITFFISLTIVAIFMVLYGAFYTEAELSPAHMLSYLSAIFVDESMSETWQFKSTAIRWGN